jgi:hypothetical protein
MGNDSILGTRAIEYIDVSIPSTDFKSPTHENQQTQVIVHQDRAFEKVSSVFDEFFSQILWNIEYDYRTTD